MTEAVLEQAHAPGFWARMRQDVDCVFDRDPAARTRFEVLTTYPGLHSVFLYRIAHALWVRGWRWGPRFISYIGRVWTSIDIHPGATIGLRFFIDHGIDLDHHLIPDPVAGAIACLLERIHLLEQRVGTHGCTPGGTEPADECRRCDARLVCEPDTALNVED